MDVAIDNARAEKQVPRRERAGGGAPGPAQLADILEPRDAAHELLESAHAAECARSAAAPWTRAIRSPIDADELLAAWHDVERKIAALPDHYATLARAVDRAAGCGVIEIGADRRITYAEGYRRRVDEFVSLGESRLLKGRENEIRLILAAPAIALRPAAVRVAVQEARNAARDYFLPAAAEAIAQANWLALGPPPKSVNAVLASRPYRFAGIGLDVDIHRLNSVTYHAGMWSAAVGVWWFNHLHGVADDLAGAEHLATAPIALIPPGQLIGVALAALGVPLVLLIRRHWVVRRQLAGALANARGIVQKLRPLCRSSTAGST